MAQQSITLQTSDADVNSGDILGRVNYAASNESSGSEAKWIGASIYAEASGEFTASVNPTNLVFATSDADGVTARLKLTNIGHLWPNLTNTYDLGSASLEYRSIYANTGVLDRINATGIQLTGSASQSGLLYINNSNLISSSTNVLFSNSDLASPKLIFKASGTTTPDLSLNILTTASGTTSGVQTLSVQGSAGELFSITDVLDSGTIFSVNDISGLSLIEADASGVVTLVRYGTNVAVGDLTPTQKLHVGGNIRVSGAYYDSLNSPGTSGQVLVSTAVGTDWKTLSEIVGVDGVGTSGYLARWIDAETISSGIIFDNGTNIGIGTASPSQKLHVNGHVQLDQNIYATQSNLQFLTTGGGALPIKVGSLTISSTYGGVNAPMSGLYVQGNVGIGTVSPSTKLHIQTITGDVSESGGLTIQGVGTGARTWQLTPTTSDTLLLAVPGLRIAAFNPAGKFFAGGLSGTSGAGARFTASTSGVTIGGNYATAVPTPEGLVVEGRVGIGTTSPTSQLQINTASATTTGIIVRGAAAQSADLLQVQNSAGTTLLDIDAAGSISGVGSGIFMQRVGIGISNPSYPLHVGNGGGYFTGSIYTEGWYYGRRFGTNGWINDDTYVQTQTGYSTLFNVGATEIARITSSGLIIGKSNQLATLDVLTGGATTASRTGVLFVNNSTSSTAGISRIGLFVASTGTWSGASTNVQGVTVRSVGGANTYGINIIASGSSSNLYGFLNDVTVTNTESIIAGTWNYIHNDNINTTNNKTYYGNYVSIIDTETTASNITSYGISINSVFNSGVSAGDKFGVYNILSVPAASSGYGYYLAGTNIDYGLYITNETQNYLSSRLGIGIAAPTQSLHVNGNVRFNGALYDNLNTAGASGQVLVSTSTGIEWRNVTASGGGGTIDGTGSASYLARWLDADTLGTGLVYDNGTSVGIGQAVPTARLHVQTSSATATGVIIRGAASQSADLQQWQNSAGTVLARVDAAGSVSGVASGIFGQNLRVANIPSGTTETDIVLTQSNGTFVKRSVSSLGFVTFEDSIINALIFG